MLLRNRFWCKVKCLLIAPIQMTQPDLIKFHIIHKISMNEKKTEMKPHFVESKAIKNSVLFSLVHFHNT